MISNELILAGKLQLKKLQKKKPEKNSGFDSLPARINSLLITRRSKYDLFHILFVIKTPLRGRKDPLKFASLPTCGFVAQLVERPTSIREARVQAPSKPEFFSGFFFCNFFNCSLPARINSLPKYML